MPDLVGKPYEQAYALLAKYNVAITRRSIISASAVGTVVGQDPVGGANFSQRATLNVAVAPSVVPDVTKSTFGDAQARLTSLGFSVVEVPTFDKPTLADGLVVSQDPPPGTDNAGEVRLSVVRAPVEAYLADMQTVSQSDTSQFKAGPAKSNGNYYPHAVTIAPSQYGSGLTDVEYDLSRQYRRLVADLGVLDTSSSSAAYRIEIYGDNRRLFSNTVALGAVKAVTVDVTKVLRLRISISGSAGSGSGDQSQSGVVLGDIRVQGLQAEVATDSPSPSPS